MSAVEAVTSGAVKTLVSLAPNKTIPNDNWHHVFSYLNTTVELPRVQTVCREWRKLSIEIFHPLPSNDPKALKPRAFTFEEFRKFALKNGKNNGKRGCG